MKAPKGLRPLALMLTLVAGVALPAHSQIKTQKVGNPAWQPVDIHMFSGVVGSPDNGYADFGATMEGLLPSPNHAWVDGLGRGPGAPHPGPYTHELADGMKALGLKDMPTYSLEQTATPNAIYLIWMTVPTKGAPNGSSPDFANGPIIPNSIFPITVTVDNARNGEVLDVAHAVFTVPSLNDIPTPYNVDGHSHFPFFYADLDFFSDLDAVPPLHPAVHITYLVQLRDQQGNGWDITTDFRIVPSNRK